MPFIKGYTPYNKGQLPCDKEIQQKAIKLRIVDKKSTPEIARELKIPYYRAGVCVSHYPLTKEEKAKNWSLVNKGKGGKNKGKPSPMRGKNNKGHTRLKVTTPGGAFYWYLCYMCNRWKPETHFQPGRIKQSSYICKNCIEQQYAHTIITEEMKAKKKARKKIYNKTDRGKEVNKKHAHKARKMGYIELNKSFHSSVAHHPWNCCVVHIPKEIHLKFTGYPQEKHRKLLLEFYNSIENMINNPFNL
jgi:hypothetical protein